jgi:hypothetical protein
MMGNIADTATVMGKSKKSTSRLFGARQVLAFTAGIVLPVALAAGWHLAYGQQGGQSPDRQAVPYEALGAPPSRPASPKPASAPLQPGRQELASTKPAPAAREAQTNGQPVRQERREDPAGIQEEVAAMRRVFKESVSKATIERIDRAIKAWGKAPKLQQIMEERRQRLLGIDQAYFDFVTADAARQFAQAGVLPAESQFFVWADRNPRAQIIVVCFYDAAAKRFEVIGADLISSGNIEKGGDYFETPKGVFENLVENFSYRAQGTPNQEGWRGLGAKDSRVWDFGDQRGLKRYKEGNTMSQMRLLMHSTDPDRGEQRLGRTDSKGCIRISQGLNRFLDTHAILDLHYEQWAKTKPDSWLFKKERKPVEHPGRFLIIGDSSGQNAAQARQ